MWPVRGNPNGDFVPGMPWIRADYATIVTEHIDRIARKNKIYTKSVRAMTKINVTH